MWIFNNQDETAVISLPSGVNYGTGIIDLSEIESSGPFTSDNIEVIYLGFKKGEAVNYRISKALNGELYFGEFGPDVKPLQVRGLILNPSCEADDTGQTVSVVKAMEDFFDTYAATSTDVLKTIEVDFSSGSYDFSYVLSGKPTKLVLTLDGLDHYVYLVDYSLTFPSRVGNPRIPVFGFTMTFIQTGTE